MAVQLSEATKRRLERLFSGADRDAVESLLVHECGETLHWPGGSIPESLERVRFAALEFSQGDVARLLDAVRLAQIDWRDLLMAAGFGEDVNAHSK